MTVNRVTCAAGRFGSLHFLFCLCYSLIYSELLITEQHIMQREPRRNLYLNNKSRPFPSSAG